MITVQHTTNKKRKEITVFIALAIFLAPILAVAIVGGFGFSLWLYHALVGLPTS